MRILHLVERYLPLTTGWIYNQINCDKYWRSEVGAIHRTLEEHYPYPAVHAFTDRWSAFKKGRLQHLLSQYPQIGIAWLLHYYRKTAFDVMHCHFGNFGFHALPLKKHLKIPMVTMFYGFDASRLPKIKPIWTERYLELFGKGDLFLVEGNHMKATLMKLGCAAEKIRIFHLGVDIERIPYKPRRLYEDGTLRLLAAGSFREKKGLPYAVEAFALARKDYPRMTLTIIGDASGARGEEEEREKRKILESVTRNKLQNCVTFLGYQPHNRFIEALYRHHLFISPSVTATDGDTEGGSPVAITEASASGVPIISTWHCDIPEVVIHKKSGLLVKERDVDSLHKAILHFIEDHEYIEQYGSTGRAHIEAEYSLDVQMLKLAKIYKNMEKGF